MRNLIHKFDTGTDIEIKFYQDTNTKKFAVTEFNKTTNEYNNTEWFFNYQKATDEIKNRLRAYKHEEEKPNFKTYTMNDWKKDGKLNLQIGQYIDNEVFNQLKNNIQPRAYSRRCFQPGEVHCKSVSGEDLYHTFTMDNGWMYLGLCPGNSTTPEECINENKKNKNMKNSIKLTENEFKSLIKESVSKILNEIGNTPKGQKALGAFHKNLTNKLKEDFDPYGIVEWNHFDNDNFDTDYYNGFVVVDSTRAVLGNFDNYNEAVEYARELASKNKYGTYEVYGCDEDGYALEEDYPEDNTLVYSTDEDFQ